MPDNTPLDAGLHFDLPSDARPAGAWMERYWAQTASWAKRFSYVLWGFMLWDAYNTFALLHLQGGGFDVQLIMCVRLLISSIPTLILSLFCFRFGLYLQRALATQEQWWLEKAFVQLYRALMVALIVGVLWLFFNMAQWLSFIQLQKTMQ